MLVVSLCKPVIHKLKILGGRKLEYYKSMGGNHEKVGGGANFEVSVGGSKWGVDKYFDSNLVGSNLGGILASL